MSQCKSIVNLVYTDMDDQSEVATEAPSVGSNNIEPPVSDGQHIITDSMKAEEEKLHLDTLQKENAMKEAREKVTSGFICIVF